jgi:hypothetical protein
MSSVLIFFLFFFSFIIFSLTGFFIVRTIFIDVWDDHLPEQSMSISGSILAVLSIFVSIPLSFIILFLWTNYNDTILALQKQSNQLLTMYNTIKLLEDKSPSSTNLLLKAMKQYILHKIIYTQFQSVLYEQNDGSIIYQQIILMSNNIVPQQFTTQDHVNVEVWLVIGLGCGSVICATWFVKSPFLLHLYLIMSVAGILGSLVFLVYYYNTIDCYICIRDQLQKQLIEQLK